MSVPTALAVVPPGPMDTTGLQRWVERTLVPTMYALLQRPTIEGDSFLMPGGAQVRLRCTDRGVWLESKQDSRVCTIVRHLSSFRLIDLGPTQLIAC